MRSQLRVDQLIYKCNQILITSLIIQLQNQQHSFRNNPEQRNLETKNYNIFEEIQILVQTIKSQDQDIVTLKYELMSYQSELSFMNEVIKEDISRFEISIIYDKYGIIVELENESALLVNENTRLNQIKMNNQGILQCLQCKLNTQIQSLLLFIKF